jgi:hypothetical protein
MIVQQQGQGCWRPDANTKPIAKNGPNEIDV